MARSSHVNVFLWSNLPTYTPVLFIFFSFAKMNNISNLCTELAIDGERCSYYGSYVIQCKYITTAAYWPTLIRVWLVANYYFLLLLVVNFPHLQCQNSFMNVQHKVALGERTIPKQNMACFRKVMLHMHRDHWLLVFHFKNYTHILAWILFIMYVNSA